MKSARVVAVTAGFAFIMLAIVIQGLVPASLKETGVTEVTKTVRTQLGTLREVSGDAMPFEGLVEQGRRIYIREGCWYCHSQYVRPVAGEERRWGPVSQVGEYAYDVPHLFGTRRIGPDLTRDGGKYGDDWHRVHFFNSRLIVPESIMPEFTWFYDKDEDNQPVLNDEGKAVVAYIQRLGMNRGKWRDDFAYQIASSGSASIESQGSISRGGDSYMRRCSGCHGEKGGGDGPAENFFKKVKPRVFTDGVFKFRSTPSGSIPLGSDLYRTITVGVRGTAMPPWFNLPENERWDLVHFIKTFSDVFEEEEPEEPIFIPSAPEPDENLLAHGKDLYDRFQCFQCHGKQGNGDGPSADALTDDWGDQIAPTDFTTGIFKVGPRAEDIYRTFMTGLSGTPMPSFASILPEQRDRWALSYFVLSFSADEVEAAD